jgi:hypothetical protein
VQWFNGRGSASSSPMTAVWMPSAVERAGSSSLAEGQKGSYEVQVVQKRRKRGAKSMRLTTAAPNGVAV